MTAQAQFIDLCILMGCDYADTIKGIGPKTALTLIREHGSMEGVLAALAKKKTPLPEAFPYEEARHLFVEPEVADASTIELKWTDPVPPMPEPSHLRRSPCSFRLRLRSPAPSHRTRRACSSTWWRRSSSQRSA